MSRPAINENNHNKQGTEVSFNDTLCVALFMQAHIEPEEEIQDIQR